MPRSAAYSPWFGEGQPWAPQLSGHVHILAKKTYCSTGQNPQAWKWKAALSRTPGMNSPSLATRQCQSLTPTDTTHVPNVLCILQDKIKEACRLENRFG